MDCRIETLEMRVHRNAPLGDGTARDRAGGSICGLENPEMGNQSSSRSGLGHGEASLVPLFPQVRASAAHAPERAGSASGPWRAGVGG